MKPLQCPDCEASDSLEKTGNHSKIEFVNEGKDELEFHTIVEIKCGCGYIFWTYQLWWNEHVETFL